MRARDVLDLMVLAAIWGASFLFTRVAVPEFGSFALIFVRALAAALFLLPLVFMKRQWQTMLRHWRAIMMVGVFNCAIPFVLFAWALLSITSGFASIGNATAALWTPLVAWLWLGERLAGMRLAGLMVGFVGVGILAADDAGVHGPHGWLAVMAVLLATLMYGLSANIVRRQLQGVPALSIALGTQLVAIVLLSPLAWLHWPATVPGTVAWGAVMALGVGCSALAFVLYFRLIGNVGASRAAAVAYLIPAFGMAWGALVLDETVTVQMLIGAAVVLMGVAMSAGVIDGERLTRWRGRRTALASARRSE